MDEKLAHIRREYQSSKLDIDSIRKDPFEQFGLWMDDALKGGFLEPTALVLSTVSPEGRPSSRVLLLKGFDARGFVFYSNYDSRKGMELKQNPFACMVIFWDRFDRQVRIEGKIEQIEPEQSDEYFASRPYTSRLGAWASKQSRPLKSRFTLIKDVAKLMVKYPVNVPRPPHWGGYRLVPDAFEFWQGRESRLHDRFRFTLAGNKWEIERLSP